MRAVTPLAEQWDAILSEQPGDWSQLRLELRLADAHAPSARASCSRRSTRGGATTTTASASCASCAASRFGYGAYAGLVRTRLGQLDGEGIGGSLSLLGAVEAVEPVATQGHA